MTAESLAAALRRLSAVFILVFCSGCLSGCGGKDTGCDASSLETIHTCRVGVQVGTTSDTGVTELFKSKSAEGMIERFNTSPDAVTALRQNKLDLVVVDEMPAKEFVSQSPELEILDYEFARERYAGIVALQNQELLQKINDALKTAQERGIIDKLKETYIFKSGDYHYIPEQNGSETIVMATNAQFPPYEYYDGNRMRGFEIELAYAVADIMGKKLKIDDIEFDSIINAVSSGKADFSFSGFSETEERKKFINFTLPLIDSGISIVVRKDGEHGSGLSFSEKFHANFIEQERWKYLAGGLGITLIVAFFSTLIGITGGFLLAVVRVVHHRTGRLGLLNFIVRLYINIVRGTPVMIQLLIIYYVIFASVDVSKILVAVAAFGLNSMAYTAEIIRAGINAVDPGQFEAGKSLGLSDRSIYRYIIMPQALKNVLPALANEGISLLKETSISGYIGLIDLTRGGVIIRSLTYEAFMPLMAVALIYLCIIGIMSYGVSVLERRLKKNER